MLKPAEQYYRHTPQLSFNWSMTLNHSSPNCTRLGRSSQIRILLPFTTKHLTSEVQPLTLRTPEALVQREGTRNSIPRIRYLNCRVDHWQKMFMHEMRRDGVGRFLDRIANMYGQLSKSCKRREMLTL
jgi:hypothetical protein